MKNKKAQNLSITTIILIILGVVILVLLIMGFTQGWGSVRRFFTGEPHFKITKEECVNESRYDKKLEDYKYEICDKFYRYNGGKMKELFFTCRDGFEYGFTTKECDLIYNELKILFEDCVKVEITYLESKIKKQICEPIDVGEIEIYDRSFHYNIKDDIPYAFFINKSYTAFVIGEDYYFYENYYEIYKQDLTTYWLEENCECKKIYPPEYDGLPPSRCKAEYCYLYKCGEYLVETWNQIK